MEFKYLTFEDVTRFLDAKALVKTCPSCAQHDWTLQYSRLADKPDLVFGTNVLGMSVPLETMKGMSVQMLPMGRPILPMICNICGYMKIHDYEVVSKWIQANPAPVKDEGANGNREA